MLISVGLVVNIDPVVAVIAHVHAGCFISLVDDVSLVQNDRFQEVGFAAGKTLAHARTILANGFDTARRTPAVLFSESRHFWDDILEACDQRDGNYSYWLFASRWVREALIEVMHKGSVRALRSILRALRPHLGANGTPIDKMKKRVLVAHLLPILMKESMAKIEAASRLRFGPAYQDAPPSFHPEDH